MLCDIHLVCMVRMPSSRHFSNTNFWVLAGSPYLELSKFRTVVPDRKSNSSYFLYALQHVGKTHHLHRAIHVCCHWFVEW